MRPDVQLGRAMAFILMQPNVRQLSIDTVCPLFAHRLFSNVTLTLVAVESAEAVQQEAKV